MNFRFLVLALSLISISLSAQVTLTVIAPAEVDMGDEFDAQVVVSGFTEVTSAQFEIEWDASVLQGLRVDIPVDSFTQGSPFNKSLNVGAARFLYVEQSGGSVGGTLADGSVLFQLRFKAIGSEGSTSSLAITGNNLETEFVLRAQSLLDVTVNNASVHLRGSSAIQTQEQHKPKSYWTSEGQLRIDYDVASPPDQIMLYSLAGKRVNEFERVSTSTYTLLTISRAAVTGMYVLYVKTADSEYSELITSFR